jgi:uncharacterized lipoprotein YddW (UPF0748 family)
VRQLLADVAGEIATFYDVDGIHLDYIRYPNQSFGFSDRARALFFLSYGLDPSGFYTGYRTPLQENLALWSSWRETQVTETVRTVRARLDACAPGVMLTCAVMADPFDARAQYSCSWREWLADGDVDLVMTMAYTTSSERARQLAESGTAEHADRVVHGIGIYNQPIPRALTGGGEALSRGAAGVCAFSLGTLHPDSAWIMNRFWNADGGCEAPVHSPNPALFYRTGAGSCR